MTEIQTKADKDIGAPFLTANLLRTANAGLILVILGIFAAEFGLLPPEIFPAFQTAYQAFFWAGLALLMTWSWRTTKYLEDVSSHDLTNSPPMAGFGYIIPVMSLWKPYQTVRDIFKSSRNPGSWPEDRQASIIGWWWGFYLAGNIAGLSLRAIPEEAFTQGLSDTQYVLLAIARLLALTEQVLLVIIVSRVIGWHRHKPAASAAEVF